MWAWQQRPRTLDTGSKSKLRSPRTCRLEDLSSRLRVLATSREIQGTKERAQK